MQILLFSLLIVIYTLQSILSRGYSSTYPGRADLASPVFTIVSGGILAIVTFCLAGFRFEPSSTTVILGLCNALALVLYNTCLLKASVTGPYSITMVSVIAGGIIIPAIVSAFFGDDLNWVKILCIFVVLGSVYLVARKPGETYTNKKTFFLTCFGLAIGNGVYGTLLDVQTRLTTPDGMQFSPEREEMLIITYLTAAILSAILLLAKEKRGFAAAMKQTKKSVVFLLLASVVITSAVNLMVYLISLMDTTIFYTLDNSCVFLLSVLFSCIALKEKLSKWNIIGCLTLCAALVCISLSPQIAAAIASLF